MPVAPCPHIGETTKAVKRTKTHECEECVKSGAAWLHLRTCQTCGATLCCDSSPNQHASNHSHSTGHAVVSSGEPGERWLYCFSDERFGDY